MFFCDGYLRACMLCNCNSAIFICFKSEYTRRNYAYVAATSNFFSNSAHATHIRSTWRLSNTQDDTERAPVPVPTDSTHELRSYRHCDERVVYRPVALCPWRVSFRVFGLLSRSLQPLVLRLVLRLFHAGMLRYDSGSDAQYKKSEKKRTDILE